MRWFVTSHQWSVLKQAVVLSLHGEFSTGKKALEIGRGGGRLVHSSLCCRAELRLDHTSAAPRLRRFFLNRRKTFSYDQPGGKMITPLAWGVERFRCATRAGLFTSE